MAITEAKRVTVEEGVVFGTGGGRDLKCDIYTPPGRPRNAPAVLLLHGGGWQRGDRSQLRGYGILLGRKGFVCVCSEYRLIPEVTWPALLHDVKAAIRWMRANSARLDIDPAKIAVEGNSAGAHLALMAAATPDVAEFEGEGGNSGVSTELAAAIAFYAPTYLGEPGDVVNERRSALFGEHDSVEVRRAASPVSYARADFPPTLLMHGTNDELVPQSQSIRMYEALMKAGATVELHIYAGQPHAFDAQRDFGRQCADVMGLFLSRYVTEPVTAASAAG